MASRPCIPGEGHRPFPVPSAVKEMEMVHDPQRIQPFHLTAASLLPVNPPEIHSLFLSGMMKIGKICLHKFRAGRVAVDRIFFFGIHPQMGGDSFIHFLMGPDPVGRMYIQGYPHSPVMKLPKKTGRFRKILPVPRIAGPSTSIPGINIHQMPVHIDYCHRKGNILLIKPIHQLQI